VFTPAWARTALTHRVFTGLSRRHLADLIDELADPWTAAHQGALRQRRGHPRHADSFTDLRDTLAAQGIPASAAIPAGLIESEDESRYRVILTPGQECVLFETAPDGSLIRWEIINEPRTLTNAFEAVLVGIAMVRADQIR
jgi:hypothetical protein